MRPWIRPKGTARCPTGALLYALESGAAEIDNGIGNETGDETTQITPQPGGPLLIRGRLSITTPAGEVAETHAALCRCGRSGDKPLRRYAQKVG